MNVLIMHVLSIADVCAKVKEGYAVKDWNVVVDHFSINSGTCYP